jgi:hypothetical protein
MSTTTTPSRVEGDTVAALRVPTLGWAVKRALLGILILFISITGAACLLYASIDPDEEAAPAAVSPAAPDSPLSIGQPPTAPKRV